MAPAAVLAVSLAAAGCSSTSTAETTPAMTGGRGAQDTGTYPNLNIVPKGAAPQFTEEQKAAKLADLQGAKQRQGARAGTTGANSGAMTTLARKHGEDTLKAIEGKCDPIDPACN